MEEIADGGARAAEPVTHVLPDREHRIAIDERRA